MEIAEFTVAPVAMEDSDHEHPSSSDEQDSCPASPNQSRHHDAEQVSVGDGKKAQIAPTLLPAQLIWSLPSEWTVCMYLTKK